MASAKENHEVTSPQEDSDAVLSPVVEPEPIPGIDGVPVRCKDQYIYISNADLLAVMLN